MNPLYKASQKEVAVLCDMYDDYMSLSQSVQTAERSIAQLFAQGEDADSKAVVHIKKFVEDLKFLQQTLSHAMTFGNPFVWIRYKRTAYQGTPNEMKTMGDFMEHCTPEGYICTKRYTFMNDWFLKQFGKRIEELFAREQPLIEFEQSSYISDLSHHDEFMTQWESYEYYIDDTQTVAKWENFS